MILTLSMATVANAVSPERLFPLKASHQEARIQISEGTVLLLQNDWATRLNETIITDMHSGGRIAQIEKIEAGQTVSLEFSHKGIFSICYFSGPKIDGTRRCHKIDVISVTAA